MKKYIKSNVADYDRDFNVSWWTQDGSQRGEYVEVPAGKDPYGYIEQYLVDTYGDDYGDMADYIEYDPDGLGEGDFWDDYEPIESSSEEDQLNQAILDGRPFDLDTFTKYKVDPYRAEGAVKAEDIQIGDIIQVTEDASEVDSGTVLEVIDIDYDDPDGYNGYQLDDVITFICRDEKGRRYPYNLHFWPGDYVGPIIGKQAKLDPDDLR